MATKASLVVAGFIPSGALGRRLVAMICMLALVFLGQASVGHSHTAGLTGSPSVIAAIHTNEHCPGSTHAADIGHGCVSIHAHACCTVPEAAPVVGAATRAWHVPYELHVAMVATAPIPRPPICLAA